MDKKLVSIIIPNRNYSKWIVKCIDSCLKQTYSPIEIIVVDDASTDNSIEIIKGYGDRVKLIENDKQLGPGASRNIGLKQARGEFIQYLDSDDFISRRKIELQVEQLIQKDADLCLGNFQRVFSIGALDLPGPTVKVSEKVDLYKEIISDKLWMPVHAYLFRRHLIDQIGPWREDLLIYGEDRIYRYCALSLMPRIVYVPKNLFYYREHSRDSLSKSFRDSLTAHNTSLVDIEKDYFKTCLFPDYQKGMLNDKQRKLAVVDYLESCINHEGIGDTDKAYFQKAFQEMELPICEGISADNNKQDKKDLPGIIKGVGFLVRRISQGVKRMIKFDDHIHKSQRVYLLDRWMKCWYKHIKNSILSYIHSGDECVSH